MQTPESIPQGPRARLLLGSCRFKGIFDCPCHEGSAFEPIKDLGLNTPCERCGHPLVLHNEHPGSIAPIASGLQPRIKTELHRNDHEGPSTPGNRSADNRFAMADDLPDLQEELCQRRDTVLKIAKLLVEGESVLIWGMKGTGKTTLANLLFDFLESREVKVILISSWPTASSKMKVEDVLLEYARAQFPDLTNKELPKTDLMFIISEAEEALKTARSRSAWNTLIKASESSETRPRFCIFSHQGILPDPNSVFALMPEVSHLKTHGNGDGQLSLFFTLAEFEEYFQQNHARYGYELHRDAADHIYWLTAGHPTILRLVLRYIKLHINYTAAGVPHITTPVILRSDIITMMHNKDGLFIYLGDNVYPGSYARENKSVINIFKKLLQSPEGKIGWDSTATKTVIEKCFLNGLIIHEIDATNPDEDVFRFPSPLHARWAGWYHKIETDVDVYAGELTP